MGVWILGGGSSKGFTDLDSLRGWADMGTEVSARLMLGSTVVGLAMGFLSYYLGLPLIRRMRQRRSASSRLR